MHRQYFQLHDLYIIFYHDNVMLLTINSIYKPYTVPPLLKDIL